MPEAKPEKIRRRKSVSSAIITRTPVKKRLFPQQSGDSLTDEKEAFAHSESDASLAPQTDELVIFKCGNFVIANVHTAARKCKNLLESCLVDQIRMKTLNKFSAEVKKN